MDLVTVVTSDGQHACSKCGVKYPTASLALDCYTGHDVPGPREISFCHGAPIRVSTADDGTSCYICTSCGNPCDPMPDNKLKPQKDEPWWVAQVRSFYKPSDCKFTIRFINEILRSQKLRFGKSFKQYLSQNPDQYLADDTVKEIINLLPGGQNGQSND